MMTLLTYHAGMQEMPYALFGTCLGAIVAYELAQHAQQAGLPPPVALFAAAVSPPHLYAEAVAQLYAAPGSSAAGAEMMADVLGKLQDWQSLPKDLIMQVQHQTCINTTLPSVLCCGDHICSPLYAALLQLAACPSCHAASG